VNTRSLSVPQVTSNPKPAAEVLSCWSCGQNYSQGRGVCGDHFCGPRCQQWFDDGRPRCGEPPQGRGPWKIIAGGDPGYLPGGVIQAPQARASRPVKQLRWQCEQCQADIPRFRGAGKARRAVKKSARFCSHECARKARRGNRSGEADGGQKGRDGAKCQNPGFGPQRARQVSEIGPLFSEPKTRVGRAQTARPMTR
jgi:hypothetical protein